MIKEILDELVTESYVYPLYVNGKTINLEVDKDIDNMDTITREDFVSAVEREFKKGKNKGSAFLSNDGITIKWRKK